MVSNNSMTHTGIVADLSYDAYGHMCNVYIAWSTKPPDPSIPIIGYNEKHGYHGINIHNCRQFKIIREGKLVS